METTSPKISLPAILITGIAAGVLYFLLNLVLFFPFEQLGLMKSGFLRINLFVYSLSLWTVGFTALAGVLHLVTAPLGGGSARAVRSLLRHFLVFLGLGLVFTTGYAIWHGYAGTPPHVPRAMKADAVEASMSVGAGLSAVIALILTLVASRGRSWSRFGKTPRPLLAAFGACLLYVLVLNLPIDYARHQGGPASPDGTPRVIVFGVDAGSWNVLLPFIEAGDMPAFSRMMEEGTYGYLATYGTQYTPPSWTTIATGKEEKDHGVHTFTDMSTDWTAAPLWSILSRAGRRTGVVNWVCTWPPFEVDGGFISKVMGPQVDNTYFSEDVDSLRSIADEILHGQQFEVAEDLKSKLAQAGQEMDLLQRIDREVMSPLNPDFLAYYYYAPDTIQHFFWDEMAPELFADGDWSRDAVAGTYREAVRESWRLADAFLSHLLENYGDDAYYVVVSDHGGRPVQERKVDFDMETLLEELGFLTLAAQGVDFERSTCYVARGITPHFVFELKIPPSRYTEEGTADLAQYRQLRDEIVGDLRSVRLRSSQQRLFTEVSGRNEPGEGERADIRLIATKVLMDMPDENDVILAADQEIPVDRLLRYHPWSGRHRPRGIVLAKGPAVEHRYTGAWTIDDPYTVVLRYARGIIKAVDPFSGILRKLHVIDEMTTLDVAPTILHVFGLPVALDMDGRVAVEWLDGELGDASGIESIATYETGETLHIESDPHEQERMHERLRALGYVQ